MKRSGIINAILELAAQGKSIRAIARNTVRRYLLGKLEAVPRPKGGYDAYPGAGHH